MGSSLNGQKYSVALENLRSQRQLYQRSGLWPAVLGTQVAYAHAGDLTEAALKRAAATCDALFAGKSGVRDVGPSGTNAALYPAQRSDDMDLAAKIAALNAIDIRARAADARVVQVSASIVTSFQAIRIERLDAAPVADLRPLCRLSLAITLESNGVREQGTYGWGGRDGLSMFLTEIIGIQP